MRDPVIMEVRAEAPMYSRLRLPLRMLIVMI